jgi:hypothetical protein
MPTAMVLGCDQICVGPDGFIFDKPETPDDARAHLAQLSGKVHRLISAAVICEQGEPVWRVIDTAQLTMRNLSPRLSILMSKPIGMKSATVSAATGLKPKVRNCSQTSAAASLRLSECRCFHCLIICA